MGLKITLPERQLNVLCIIETIQTKFKTHEENRQNKTEQQQT